MPFLAQVHRVDRSYPFSQGRGLECVQEMGLKALDFYLMFRSPRGGHPRRLNVVIRVLGSLHFCGLLSSPATPMRIQFLKTLKKKKERIMKERKCQNTKKEAVYLDRISHLRACPLWSGMRALYTLCCFLVFKKAGEQFMNMHLRMSHAIVKNKNKKTKGWKSAGIRMLLLPEIFFGHI